MRRRTLLLRLGGLPLVALVAATPVPAPAQTSSRLVLVVGQDSPLRQVSTVELRKLFLRGSDSIKGETLVPFNHAPGSPLRIKFDQVILAMTEAQVGRYWIDRRLRGQPGPPRSADSSQLLRRIAARLKGAITYVPADQLDASVRALDIDGKSYTDPNYALR